MGEAICPYCGAGFQDGEQLWPIYVVEGSASLIVTPGQQPGSLKLRQLLAHNYCARTAAVPLDGRVPELSIDYNVGTLSVRLVAPPPEKVLTDG